MPAIFGVFLVLAVAFQLFFRYESWPSKNSEGDIYERDRLTGETHKLSPGDKVGIIARLTGDFSHVDNASETQAPEKPLTWQQDSDQSQTLVVTAQTTQQESMPAEDNYAKMADPLVKRHLDYSRYRNVEAAQEEVRENSPEPIRTPHPAPLKATPKSAPAQSSPATLSEPLYQMSMVENTKKLENTKKPENTKQANTKTLASTGGVPTPLAPATPKTEPSFRAVPLVSSPPTPPTAASAAATTFVPQTRSQAFDLNRDGVMEQIIQTRKSDGSVVISVVWQGKELFFAQGQQLQILPSSNVGWSDLALVSFPGTQKWFYRFDPRQEAYVKTQSLPLRPTLASDDSHFAPRY
ncbi:MAG: hypothetical protein VKJ04_07065 [Vampirovibrionales bacterium]|nr:hypothetical protein [Vampirovibrionales bacterium]